MTRPRSFSQRAVLAATFASASIVTVWMGLAPSASEDASPAWPRPAEVSRPFVTSRDHLRAGSASDGFATEIDTRGVTLGKTRIRAPFAGKVGLRPDDIDIHPMPAQRGVEVQRVVSRVEVPSLRQRRQGPPRGIVQHKRHLGLAPRPDLGHRLHLLGHLRDLVERLIWR